MIALPVYQREPGRSREVRCLPSFSLSSSHPLQSVCGHIIDLAVNVLQVDEARQSVDSISHAATSPNLQRDEQKKDDVVKSFSKSDPLLYLLLIPQGTRSA